MFGHDQPLQPPPPESHRPQQPQFAAPFEHVAQDDHPARAAQQQAQPAQGLKGAQVGILHGVELVQAPRAGVNLAPRILQGARVSTAETRGTASAGASTRNIR